MVEPDVVVVPAGDALLGDPPRTEHVNVFAIARRPVRVGEYAVFVDETHQYPPLEWEQKRRAADLALVRAEPMSRSFPRVTLCWMTRRARRTRDRA